MNKNTLTAILMGFIVCLGILVIVISIKLSIRPNVEDSSQTGKPTDGVVIETQPTATPTPVITEAPQVPEVTTVIVTMVRTTETVNVRDDSSVNGNKLGSAVKGSEFVMIDEKDERYLSARTALGIGNTTINHDNKNK